jgi:hypothetical protein
MTSAHSVFEVIFLFLVQLDCEIKMPEIGRGPLPMNIAGSQIPKVPSGYDPPDAVLSTCQGLRILKVDCHPSNIRLGLPWNRPKDHLIF